MNNFKLKGHRVREASFIENREKEKKNSVEVSVEGGILIPKDLEKSQYVAVKLNLQLGSPEERFYLTLETLSTFEVERREEDIQMKEEEVQTLCLPTALTELRKTVKKVTEAYGMPTWELPPFEGETTEE